MQGQGPSGHVFRFGTFELDRLQGTLTKSGLRVRLQGQPFQILTLLIERPAQIVTREEIRQKLWSGQTFVEFDDALNTAMGKLRAALGDAAENPRFIETVPRRGYRFIAPVVVPAPATPQQGATLANPSESPEGTGQGPVALATEATASPPWFQRRRTILIASTILLAGVAASVTVYWRGHSSKFKPLSGDTVVIADFVNTTGEQVFEDALRQALEIGLEQSPSIQIMPERKASVIFTQMGHTADDRMTGRSAIEVCQRAGGKVTIQGSITNLGSVYLLGLAAIRCDNGDPIANEQATARHKEDVVDALGRLTSQIRAQLGESLPSIQRYNSPLEQATTSSLDALNAYSLALLTWDKKGDIDSLPIFKKAVELDPKFAQAHGALAVVCANLGQDDAAREHAIKAYELREHVTQSEKYSIEARYYEYVTGELEKDADVRVLVSQSYPDSASSWNHLGNADESLGRFDQAAQEYRRALLLDPTRSGSYSELAIVLLALNRLDDASAVLDAAAKRSLQTEGLLQMQYRVAFLRGDAQRMTQSLQSASKRPETQALLLAEQSNTEAFYGHFNKEEVLATQASSLMGQQGDKDGAARYLAQSAILQAEVGNTDRAQSLLNKAQLLSHNQDVITLAALTAARLGKAQQVESLSKALNDQFPSGTYVQKYWLPLIRAELNLKQGHAAKALEDLGLIGSTLELVAPPAFPVATLYPAYLRGEAYLASGDAPKAAVEFQRIRDHRTAVANFPLESLALAGLARAYTHAGDGLKARQNYQQFFDIWKDADAGLPLLKELKAESAKLN